MNFVISRKILNTCCFVLAMTTMSTNAGFFTKDTPKQVMEKKSWWLDGDWGQERVTPTDPNASYTLIKYKFSNGIIMSQNNPVSSDPDKDFKNTGPWFKIGLYSFTSKSSMLVFWRGSNVGRVVKVSIDSTLMEWELIDWPKGSGKTVTWKNFTMIDI